MGKPRTYTDNQFIEAVKTSTSVRQVLSKLGLKEAGGNYKVAQQRIKKLGISIIPSDDDIQKVVSTFHQWQIKEIENTPEFCYSASLEEIEKKKEISKERAKTKRATNREREEKEREQYIENPRRSGRSNKGQSGNIYVDFEMSS
jgi:hypothetical protein